MASKLKLQANGFIYLQYWTSKSTTVKISTKIRVKADQWNKAEGKLINPKLKDEKGRNIADQLKKFEGSFLFAIDEFKAGRTTNIEKTYSDNLNIVIKRGGKNAPIKVLAYFQECLDNPNIMKGTGYQTTYNNLLAFCGRKRPVFEDIDVKFMEEFVNFLETKKGYKVATIRSEIKLFRAVINRAMFTDKVHNNIDQKGFKLEKAEDIASIYLTSAEIDKIYNLNLKNHPELIAVRDSFIVGCFTGLRFSDWGKVRSDTIVNGFFEIKAKKSKVIAKIPVKSYVTAILKKYGGKMPKQGWNSETNKALKEICKGALIRSKVVQSYKKGGVDVVCEPVPKYELVCTHTARRSLCTNLIKEGQSPYTVMKISGHKSLEAFQKYIQMDAVDMGEALKKSPFFN